MIDHSSYFYFTPKKGEGKFGYFRLRSARYATAAMIATAMTAMMIAMSVPISGCSGWIVPPAAAAGPTRRPHEAPELP